MIKKVSIYDIAARLGVSGATVSRALKDDPSIGAGMTARVKQLATDLQYTPNLLAQRLQSGKSKTIAVIVPNINRNFFSSAIEGIEDQAYALGYDVLICQSKDSEAREKLIVESLSTGKVDGVIASVAGGSRDHSYYKRLIERNIPLVLFDRSVSSIETDTVVLDDYRGAYMAVEHLIDQGYRRIFHFAGPSHISIWAERKRGYREAMERYRLKITPESIFEAPTTEQQGRLFGKHLLESRILPEAVFFAGDYAALGAMLALQEAEVKIPDEIAMVGFANEPFCALIEPPLTSVDQCSYSMGQKAAQSLLDRIAGGPVIRVVIPPKLILRASSIKEF